MAFNKPHFAHNSNNGEENKIKRYVHSPLETEHNGITARIKENGRIILSKPAGLDSDQKTPIYDEIEIPASLVFKLSNLLKATRKVKFVSLAEAGNMQASDEAVEE
jgi:hypothetical protein